MRRRPRPARVEEVVGDWPDRERKSASECHDSSMSNLPKLDEVEFVSDCREFSIIQGGCGPLRNYFEDWPRFILGPFGNRDSRRADEIKYVDPGVEFINNRCRPGGVPRPRRDVAPSRA